MINQEFQPTHESVVILNYGMNINKKTAFSINILAKQFFYD